MAGATEIAEWQRRVNEVIWHFRMDLGHGIVTPGSVDVLDAVAYCRHYGIPEDLTGQSVLDIGSADGFFSFEAERRGATRVVSMDVDLYRNCDFGPGGYTSDLARTGIIGYAKYHGRDLASIDLEAEVKIHESIDFRKGFVLAKEILASKVERVHLDVYELSPEKVGTFDVVFCFGVLYHLRNPLLALDNIARVTKQMTLINSVLIHERFPSEKLGEDVPVMRFVPGTELLGDMSYWWLPNALCLKEMILSSGFIRCEQVSGNCFRAFKA